MTLATNPATQAASSTAGKANRAAPRHTKQGWVRRLPPAVRENLKGYVLLLPSLLFLSVFTYYPALYSLFLSFFKENAYTPTRVFIGLHNYERLISDSTFWTVIRNNAIFSLGTIPVSLAFALLLAILLNKRFRGVNLFRAVFFHPTLIPLVAAAALWLFIFLPRYGLLDHYFTGFLGGHEINWLGDPRYALFAMMMLTIWKNAGYYMVFFLAGLQNIPAELFDAANVEGAGAWKRLTLITLPLLTPTTLFVLVVAIIGSFQWVDQVWMLTQGGPNNATNLLLYYIYQNAFKYFDFGYGSTLTMVLVAILVILAALSMRTMEKRVYYEN